MIWKLILKKNEIHKHVKRNLTLTLITFTNIIKHLGEQSNKLYNKSYLNKLTFFPEEFLEQFNNNANEPHNVPTDVKNNLNQMDMEQGLYSQVFILRLKSLKIAEINKNKIK